MDAGVISALVTGVCAIVGIVVTNVMGNNKLTNCLDKAQAVTDCKIDELTREVREHNNFARRMPLVEEQIKNLNHRVDGLEQEKKGK